METGGSGSGRRCGVFSDGRSLALGVVVSLSLIVGCRTNDSDAGDGSNSSDDATDYGTDEGTTQCTDPMPGLCDENAECGKCGTCKRIAIIEIDERGDCSCRNDLSGCTQGYQDQPVIDYYLTYHVEMGFVVLNTLKLAYPHPSWANCSDGNGPPACACDANAVFEKCPL